MTLLYSLLQYLILLICEQTVMLLLVSQRTMQLPLDLASHHSSIVKELEQVSMVFILPEISSFCYPGLLGILQYGVHLNGYVRTGAGDYKLWIGKRSDTKATYPGMLDNMVHNNY